MPTYSVLLLREMSQPVTVEAETIEDAAAQALDLNDLSANVSNNFDDSGEVEVFAVTDAETGIEVWNAEHYEPLDLP